MPLLTQAARVLEIVASSGSIRKASERINLAPSAINRQVLNLEAEMGTPLFNRHARGMILTEAGKLVIDRLRGWQAEDQALRVEIDDLKGRKGLVRLGIMECFTRTVLPEVYRKLDANRGATTLEVFTGGTTEIAKRMEAGELDLAVAFNLPGELGLRIFFEARFEIGIVVKPTEELRKKRYMDRSDLQGRQVVLSDRSLTIETIVRAMIEQMGLSPRAVVRSNSIDAIKALVMEGAGVSFLTWADVSKEVANGDLLFLPLPGRRAAEILTLSGKHPVQMSDNVKMLADLLVENLGDLAKSAETGQLDAVWAKQRK